MARYTIKQSEADIDEVLNKASDGVDQGSKWPGMSYEEGVTNALNWLFGDGDNPMED